MNIFEQAKMNEQLKLPSEYFVTRNRKIKVRVSYVKEFWLNGLSYTHSIYGSDFDNRIEFEEFLFRNIKKVSKIISNNSTSYEIFTLKNGLLHDCKKFSYSKNKNKNTDYYYFIDGREFSEHLFKSYLRKQKLKKIM